MAQELDRLLLRIDADLSSLRAQMKSGETVVKGGADKMTAAFGGLSRAMGALGVGVGVGAIGLIGKRSLDAAGNLGEMATQAGLTTDSLQELIGAGAAVGVGTDQLVQAIAKFNTLMGDASKGNDTAIATFNGLGVKILDVNGNLRMTDVVLDDVADAIMRMETPQARLSAAADLFGERMGRRLIPMLEGGAAGMAKFRDEARRLGLVLDADAVAAADAASDAMALLNLQFQKMAETLVTKLAPILGKIVGGWQIIAASVLADDTLADKFGDVTAEITRLEIELQKLQDLQKQGAGGTIKAEISAVQEQLVLERAALADIIAQKRDQLLATPMVPLPGANPRSAASEAGSKFLAGLRGERSIAELGERDAFIQTKVAGYEGAAGKLVDPQELDAVRQLAAELYDLNKIKEESKKIDDELAAQTKRDVADLKKKRETKEEAIFSAEQEVEQQEKLLEALREGEPAYERMKAYYDIINAAKRSGLALTEEEIARAKDAADALGDNAAEMDRLKQKYSDNKSALQDYTRVIGTALEESALDFTNWRDVVTAAFQDIFRIVLRYKVSKPVDNYFGSKFSDEGSGVGGIFDDIGGLFGGIFGGERAAGGDVFPGRVYSVNENGGRELFAPSVPGRIMSTSESSGVGGGIVIQQYNSFAGGVTEADIYRMLPQITAASRDGVADARRRGAKI